MNNIDIAPVNDPSTSILHSFFKLIKDGAPFIIIILLKEAFSHQMGIVVFVAMLGTSTFLNNRMSNLVLFKPKKYSREFLLNGLYLGSFILLNIFMFYFVYSEQHLYRSLLFLPTEIKKIDVWNLVWVVATTDFIVKYLTILCKILISIVPHELLSIKYQGVLFELAECISQLYRCLIPIVSWFLFIFDETYSSKFSALLFIPFFIFKGMDIYDKIKILYTAIKEWQQKTIFRFMAADSTQPDFFNFCAICHDKFDHPVSVICQHTFCESCIERWLIIANYCPLCKTDISTKVKWRNASTSQHIQFY